jgi:hypothetical protein
MVLLLVTWTFPLQHKAVLLQKHLQTTKLARDAPTADSTVTTTFINADIPLLSLELVILTKRKYEAKRTIGGLVAGNWCLLGTAHWNGSRDIFTTAISASPHGRRVHVTK